MSAPDIVKGTYVAIAVETTIGGGTFTRLCGLSTKRLTEQVNTRDVFTRDCADPEDIPFRRLVQTGKQWDLSGSGQYNRAQAGFVSSLVGVRRLYRFFVGEPADDAVYQSYFEGYAQLTQRQIAGSDEDFTNAELTIASDGQWTETKGDGA
jgi:hypothetical protein